MVLAFTARSAFIAAAILAFGGSALAAQPVALRQNPVDDDGRVTLGEVFDGAGAASGVLLATVRPGSSAVLDAAEVQRMALTQGLVWTNAQGLRRIIVRPGAPAPMAAAGGVEVLTYTRSLAAGETVGPADLVWTKAAGAPVGAPRDSGLIIGMSAKRPLRAGAMATLNDVSAPLVIRKDDIVSVSYSADGVSLTLQGKALQAAAVGETVNVLNPVSKKTVQAVAVAPAQAVVGPQAAQFRTAANPAAFAALR